MKQKIQGIHKIPANNVVINPGGVDLNSFRPFDKRQKIKSELGFPEDSIHLLTVRNLEPRMGLDNLLKAIYLLRKRQVEVYLIIGGEGPERAKLQHLIEKYDLSNDASMVGFIPNDKLAKYYSAADYFILPTRKLEGFGLVTPESMACGTPVCGTPIGGTKEILENFDNDCLFKNSSPEAIVEGIQKIIKSYSPNSERYENLRRKCRQYAEHNFSWQQHLKKLKSEIKKIAPL
jgi:glycosyltransferase involved in cell wall biosynthesis